MAFNFSGAQAIDTNGSIVVECMVTDADDNDLMSFSCHVEGSSVYQEAQTAAQQWVLDNAGAVAPFVAPTMANLKSRAKAQVLGILTNLVTRVTSQYLPTDPIQWPAKAAEARAFIEILEGSQTLDHAPIVAAGFTLANPTATSAEILVLVKSEMPKVIANADAFEIIDNFTSKVRINAYPLIAAASTEGALLQIVADVDTETNAFIAAEGL